jgi:UPF0042 nucleotide-binding protein
MITIKSFGYGHPDGAPPAHVTVDLRTLFQDPHVSPEMRNLTGKDPAVIQSVMRQPGAEALLRSLTDVSMDLFADALTQELRAWYRSVRPAETVTVEHRDIDKPVLVR